MAGRRLGHPAGDRRGGPRRGAGVVGLIPTEAAVCRTCPPASGSASCRSPRTGPAGTDGPFEYEDLDIRGYEDVPALRRGLARSFAVSNPARLHQALGYRTPATAYVTPVPCDHWLAPV